MKSITYILFLTTSQINYGQQAIVCSGGSSSGSNGKLSYSIGLIDYKSADSQSEKITCGIQQPFEIYKNSTKKVDTNNEFHAIVYPNNFNEAIQIYFTEEIKTPIKYELFNLNGSKIKEGEIIQSQTMINLSFLTKDFYFLKLYNDLGSKTFKLIKN